MGNSVWNRPAVKVRKAAACQECYATRAKRESRIFGHSEKMIVQPRPQQKFTVLELCCILSWIGCNAESPAREQLTGKEIATEENLSD